MRLNELAKKYSTDKKIYDGIKCKNGLYGHGYVLDYDVILKNKEIKNLLEIGVSFGGSILMWDEYFDYKCKITGIDIEEKRFKKKDLENERIKIKIGNQADGVFLRTLGDERYDLIIDDGSHVPEHQIESFNVLFEYLNSGGLYVIEDLHVANKTKNIFEKIKNKSYQEEIIKTNHIQNISDVVFLSDGKLCVITKI